MLRVFDANGDDVGIFAGQQDMFILWVYLQGFEALTNINVQDGEISRFDSALFYWESTNCTGLAYSVFPARLLRVLHRGRLEFVVTEPGTTVVTVQSEAGGPLPIASECNPATVRPLNLSPATVIDPIDPFPAPLYVAPAPAP